MWIKIKQLITPPDFADPEKNRVASILYTGSIAILAVLLLALVGAAIIDLVNQRTPYADIFSLVVAVVLLLGIAGLTRAGYIRPAGYSLLITLLLIVASTVLGAGGIEHVAIAGFVVAIIAAGLVVGPYSAVLVAAFSILFTVGLSYAQETRLLVLPPPTLPPDIVYTGIFILAGFLTYKAARDYREILTRATQANQELKSLSKSLEERVDERTRDLALAADIGQRVSRIRDLDELLPQAVELIRSRFDLYYTQIYLIDTREQNLVLRAGTGLVGQQLLQAGQRLSLAATSINATAVNNGRSVLVEDTENSPIFRPNALLPETRSELAIPLVVGSDVVGVLNLQSKQVSGLNPETIPAFEAMSGQLANAIENATVISDLMSAQAEVELQARRLTRKGWHEFLDGVRHSQLIGYRYDGHTQQVASLASPNDIVGEQLLMAPITISGEELGQIRLQQGEDRSDAQTEADRLLLEAVARRVAQQVENLRLLAETDRYRAEAEDVLRRLTRESWGTYENVASGVAYEYDRQQVKQQLLESDQENGRFPITQPLLVRGEPIGLLEIDLPDEQDAQTGGLITAVANQLSNHLENLRLAQTSETALNQAQRRSQELGQINQLVTAVSGSLDLEQGLKLIANGLADVLNVQQVAIALLNEDGDGLRIVADHYDPSQSQSAMGITIPLAGNHLSQEVLDKQHYVCVEDAQNNPRTLFIHEVLRARGVQTLYIFPIVTGNKAIGTVGIDVLEEGYKLSDEQIRLAETVIFQAATAIQNSQLFTQLQGLLENTEKQAQRLATLNTLGDQFSRSQSEEDVYQLVLDNARKLFYYDRITILSFDETADNATVLAAEDNITNELKAGMIVPLSETITQKVVKQRTVLRMVDDQEESKGRIASSLIAPLLTGRGVSGTINISSKTAFAYTSQDENNLLQLANYVSASLENLRLFATIETRAEELAVLNEVARSVSYQLEPGQLLETIFHQVRRVLPSDIFAVGIYDEEAGTVAYPYLYEDGLLSVEPPMPINRTSNIYTVVQTGESIIKTLTAAEREDIVKNHPERLVGPNAEVRVPASLLYVPLKSGQRIIGAMSIQSYEYGVYTESDMVLLTGIASHAAVALENARLFAAVQKRAQREQLVNEITQKIQNAKTVEGALQTAVQALGQALHAQHTQVEIIANGQKDDNHSLATTNGHT